MSKGNTMEKRQSFQQVVLEHVNMHMPQNKSGHRPDS